VLVLPCGFDVRRTVAELEEPAVAAGLRSVPAVHDGRCFVLDGNAYFNRPGPRLADSVELLAGVLHAELFPEYREQYGRAWVGWE
jgi:iron complex transport system substrate-binding protein